MFLQIDMVFKDHLKVKMHHISPMDQKLVKKPLLLSNINLSQFLGYT